MTIPTPVGPLLEVRGLCFHRNQDHIFGPLDFILNQGQALLVHGGNGAGKSTLLRVLAGLLTADSGQVQIYGKPVDRYHLARDCALLGHAPGHKADLTTLQNLRYSSALQGVAEPKNLENALARVGLAGFEDTAARRLSAGQNKRLGLARLSLHPGKLWLLDEPYANLDLAGIDLVDQLISQHTAAGGAVLLTTHGAYAAPPVPVATLLLNGELA